MAQIVLGIGTSHGPMLSMPPETWSQRVIGDRRNSELWFKGQRRPFDELVALRAPEHMERQLTPEVMKGRFDACQKAIRKLAGVFAEVKPDAVVIVGNDQMEIFTDGMIPAYSVYWGETIPNQMYGPERMAKMPPGIGIAVPGHIPPQGATYPGLPALGRHLVEYLVSHEFDINSLTRLPAGHQTIPHAYGFVYRQIMADKPVPSVPIVQNTFYPPNQPTLGRCCEFGRALAKGIQAWESNARVALISSGGLTHWVIDEEIDQQILDAMRNRRVERLVDLGEENFQAGTSEVKNWIPVATAMAEVGFEMNLVDYVPCYRSEAGTGNAMGFVYWRP